MTSSANGRAVMESVKNNKRSHIDTCAKQPHSLSQIQNRATYRDQSPQASFLRQNPCHLLHQHLQLPLFHPKPLWLPSLGPEVAASNCLWQQRAKWFGWNEKNLNRMWLDKHTSFCCSSRFESLFLGSRLKLPRLFSFSAGSEDLELIIRWQIDDGRRCNLTSRASSRSSSSKKTKKYEFGLMNPTL